MIFWKKQLFHFSENEARYVNSVCLDFLNGLNGDYAQSVSRKLDEVKRELTPVELAAVQQSVISATIEFIDHLPLIPNFDITEYILSNYSGEIKEHISKMFP